MFIFLQKVNMKVFGIGLNKTGTTSLGSAIEILGFDKHHSYNLEMTRHWFNKELVPLFSFIDNYNNLEDWPWPLMYKVLYERYPDAKFILTTRISSEVWFKSLVKQSLGTGPTEFRKLIYGHYMPEGHKDEHIAIYENHNKEVIEFFKKNAPEKLIQVCWEHGDGWKELCTFLNKDIPKQDFPFLNRHTMEQFNKKSKKKNNSLKGLIRRIISTK